MSEFKPGEVVAGRYEVQRLLGRGGMGMVYLVLDYDSQQRLALKTLLPQYVNNERALQRFHREVSAVRRLDHPGIVKIYDAQRQGDLLYYTMQFVEGKSLRSWMKQRGRLGLGSTIRILGLLCDALEHAHRFTIHRDLSPDNVMVLADGSIKLLDFGLAKITDADDGLTRVGVSLGKVFYNSPEQRANAAHVDLRADIYSLGVMYHEMLSGELPKTGRSLSELVPDLPAGSDAFVAKAMALDPAARFQNAREARLALMAIYEASKPKADARARGAEGAKEALADRRRFKGMWDAVRNGIRKLISPRRREGAKK